MSALGWLLVAVGGAIGGFARYAISEGLATRLGAHFPYGTILVNLLGSFGIGVLAARPLADPLQTLLMVGMLGSFTTVSSLSLQTLVLWQDGRCPAALLNLLLSVIAGVLAVAAGYTLAAMP